MCREKTTFSIIIPIKAFNSYLKETVKSIRLQSYPNWELIVLPNDSEVLWIKDNRIKVIPTGRVSPARKRDIGVENAVGELVVFLDDDSFPDERFLEMLRYHFQDKSTAAVGGPGITPRSDGF